MAVSTESTKNLIFIHAISELEHSGNKKQSLEYKHAWWGGIGFTLIISIIGMVVAQLPFFDRLGPLACSIVLAVVYRYFWGYPESVRKGIQFCSKTLLRLAIILFGLKLDIGLIFNQGPGLLMKASIVIVFSVVVTVMLGKLFKADPAITLLLGIGTGICGAAAIAAVSPILQSKDEDTAIGAGMIALVGTIFAVGYTLLQPLLPVGSADYGAWVGISLHEIAHVALAANPAGQDALAAGLLAKLSRVLLLVPFCLLLVAWKKRCSTAEHSETKMDYPWFLLGFIAASVTGSYIFGHYVMVPAPVMNGISTATMLMLSMAMVGLGLNVNVKQLRSKALKPVIAMVIVSILLSLGTYLLM